ncbi:hypothetical protein BDC45DRAFT_576920 [Circinella umbellata]|nr:hypothetical protein BDC45DRAFT_576920 [Circinella umbellata]
MTICPDCNLDISHRKFNNHRRSCYHTHHIEPVAAKGVRTLTGTSNSLLMPPAPLIALLTRPTRPISSSMTSSIAAQTSSSISSNLPLNTTDDNDYEAENYIQPLEENSNMGIESHVNTQDNNRASELESNQANVFDFQEISGGRQLTLTEITSLQLSRITNKYYLSDAAYKELVAWANDLITAVARGHEVSSSVYFYQILSPYLTQELLKTLYPVQKREYDICKNGCHLYIADDLTRCPNTDCNSPRYREIDNKPYATMVYLPLSDQLATFIANSSIRNLLTLRSAMTTSDGYHDIIDGNVIKSQNCWGDRDIILGLYVGILVQSRFINRPVFHTDWFGFGLCFNGFGSDSDRNSTIRIVNGLRSMDPLDFSDPSL